MKTNKINEINKKKIRNLKFPYSIYSTPKDLKKKKY